MRISLLLRREPFGSIIEETLASFWTDSVGIPFRVKWHDSDTGLPAGSAGEAQRWVCNIYLNAIFVPGVEDAAFGPVSREFTRSRKVWRRPFQWSYVRIATHRPFASWLAQAGLTVWPPAPGAEHLLILGGNHRIRVLDHYKQHSYVIIKHGFPRHHLQRELKVRGDWPDLPVPQLLERAPDGTWFREAYVVGTPINRLGSREVAERALEQVSKAVQTLQERTARVVDPSEHGDEIAVAIGEHLEVNRWLNEADKAEIRRDVLAAQKVIRKAARSGAVLATVQSHGDFQPANILVDGETSWLIDWEYTGRRQLAYDPLVFALKSRFPAGLAERIRQTLNGVLPCQQFLEAWPVINWGQPEARFISLATFLLEEMELRLEESHNPIFYGLDSGFVSFRPEFRAALSHLESVR